jgi:hypothetical protein
MRIKKVDSISIILHEDTEVKLKTADTGQTPSQIDRSAFNSWRNEGILEGNSVTYAINDREEYNLPIEWIPIYKFEDGNMAYLDYSSINLENEPKVIMAFYNGNEYEIVEDLAEDFGAFLLGLVQERLKSKQD